MYLFILFFRMVSKINAFMWWSTLISRSWPNSISFNFKIVQLFLKTRNASLYHYIFTSAASQRMDFYKTTLSWFVYVLRCSSTTTALQSFTIAIDPPLLPLNGDCFSLIPFRCYHLFCFQTNKNGLNFDHLCWINLLIYDLG